MESNQHPEGCDCSTCWFQRTMGLVPPEPNRVVVDGERRVDEVDAEAMDQMAKRGRRFWIPTEESLPTIRIIQGPGVDNLYRHTRVHRLPPLGASRVKDMAERPQGTITITRKDIEAMARRHAEAGRDEHDQASADAEMITAIVPPGEPMDICPNTIEVLRSMRALIQSMEGSVQPIHSSNPEHEKLANLPAMEALRDRTAVIPIHVHLSFEEFMAEAKGKIALAPPGKTLGEAFREMHQRVTEMKDRGELPEGPHVLVYDSISERPMVLPPVPVEQTREGWSAVLSEMVGHRDDSLMAPLGMGGGVINYEEVRAKGDPISVNHYDLKGVEALGRIAEIEHKCLAMGVPDPSPLVGGTVEVAELNIEARNAAICVDAVETARRIGEVVQANLRDYVDPFIVACGKTREQVRRELGLADDDQPVEPDAIVEGYP